MIDDLSVPLFPDPAQVCPVLRWNNMTSALHCTSGSNLDAFDELPPAARTALREALFNRDEAVLAMLWTDGLMSETAIANFVRAIDAREAPELTREDYGSAHPQAAQPTDASPELLERFEAKLQMMIEARLEVERAARAARDDHRERPPAAPGLGQALQKLRRSIASNTTAEAA